MSKQILSHWVKLMLKNSGLDIEKFSSHSTRHASTSTASNLGVKIDVIRNAAGWTKESQTFAKFYKLPIISDANSFAQAVLSKS